MRTLSSRLLWLIACFCAGLVAWGAWHRDRAAVGTRPAASVQCAARLESIQGVRTTDSLPNARLRRLRESLSDCIGDAVYVEQVVQELLQFQQTDSARALLATSNDRRVFAPAEHDAMEGWIELTESQIAFGDGRVADARQWRERAIARATRQRDAWPEWAPPVLQLIEADRLSVAPPRSDTTDRLAQLRSARTRLLTGAFARNMNAALFAVYIAIVALLSLASALLAVRHWLDRRARTALAPVPINSLLSDDFFEREVAVRGELRPLPGRKTLIAPFSQQPALWFKVVIGFSDPYLKHGTVSQEGFTISDDSGQLTVDPAGFRVLTTHRKITMGGTFGTRRRKAKVEVRLMDGDAVYARGILRRDESRPNSVVLSIDDNERHVISNIAPDVLRRRATQLLLAGLLLFAVGVSLVTWSDVQRRTSNVPGVLT